MSATRKILIADTNIGSTLKVATNLLAAGFAVETAADTSAAAELLSRRRIAMLIIDEHLPGGGLSELRSRCALESIPVIMLAEQNQSPVEQAEHDAADQVEVFTRPVNALDITMAVQRLLIEDAGAWRTRGSCCRALVVEADVTHREMIRECLERSGRERIDLIYAGTISEACEALTRDRFDFVLFDHNLPDGSGLEVLHRMSLHLLTTPVIGLSAEFDANMALGGFRCGALDYIEKGEAFRGDTLRRRVFEVIADHKRRLTAYAIERRREHMVLSGQQERLIAEARVDGLLGIFNRSAFDEYIQDVHRRSREAGKSYALCIVDVDHFKLYNDHYGHAQGDDVLKRVTRALQAAMRESDFMARWGGEEIAIVLEDADDAVLEAVLDRCCSNVAKLGLPHEYSQSEDVVTVSIGATTFLMGTEETVGDVFDRADSALYEAKAAGRNRVMINRPSSESGARCCA